MVNRVQKLWSSLKQVETDTFVGEKSELFYDSDTGVIRLSDGVTPGGIPVIGGGGASTLDQLTDVDLINTQTGEALIYNSVTSSFENQAINLTGGDLNQVLVKQSTGDYDYQWEDMIIQLPESTYTKLLDQASSTVLYFGEADPESLEADSVWRIQQIIFDVNGNVDEVRYAEGGLFDQIWNLRTGLTYI